MIFFDVEKFIEILKNAGAKITPQRRLILEKLSEFKNPATLQELHSQCSKVDFASIYRSIKLFDDLGIVEEIIFADNKIRYELNSKKHHHHIICSDCGEINELPICLVSEIKKLTKYKITKHTFEFMGLCPNCQ